MSISFDPLSFFTAEETKDEQTHMTQNVEIQVESVNYIIAQDDTFDGSENSKDLMVNMDCDDENNSDEETAIHVLDLPPLTNSLPNSVLITILKLLQSEQETNFSSGGDALQPTRNVEEILESKGVDINEYEKAQKWLTNNGYNRLAKNLCHIYFSPTFFQYLNKILASRFASDDTILKLTSLRISENCGRTAKPNFERKIVLRNFDRPIKLFEPALTSDNLGFKTWGSSLILSELLVQEHKKLILEPVLELGSGTGLCGITLDLLGYDVVLTDLPEILPNLDKNLELNNCKADSEVLDWTDCSSFIKKKGNAKFKTVVIADPIYSSEHPTYVVNMMEKFLDHCSEAKILLQIPIRKTFEVERERLWNLLEERNLKVFDERTIDGFDDFGAQKFVYKEIRWA